MTYIHPLFDSKIEEVSPPQLARALGFSVKVADEPDLYSADSPDYALGYIYDNGDFDGFFALWNPEPPEGYLLGGKYESEDGPYAFFVKPDSLLSQELYYHGEFSLAPTTKD